MSTAFLGASKITTKELEHGVYVTYVRDKCRCEKCRAANAEYAQKFRKNNPGYNTRMKDNWRVNNKEKQYDYHIRGKYGINLAELNDMKEAQSGSCYICKRDDKRLCIDHNHDTGAVRKLLCDKCNTRLAAIEDAEFLEKALAYLEEHSEIVCV